MQMVFSAPVGGTHSNHCDTTDKWVCINCYTLSSFKDVESRTQCTIGITFNHITYYILNSSTIFWCVCVCIYIYIYIYIYIPVFNAMNFVDEEMGISSPTSVPTNSRPAEFSAVNCGYLQRHIVLVQCAPLGVLLIPQYHWICTLWTEYFFKKKTATFKIRCSTHCATPSVVFEVGLLLSLRQFPDNLNMNNFSGFALQEESLFSFPFLRRLDISFSILTRYGLDDPGIESRRGRDFLHPFTPALGPTQPPINGVPGLSRG